MFQPHVYIRSSDGIATMLATWKFARAPFLNVDPKICQAYFFEGHSLVAVNPNTSNFEFVFAMIAVWRYFSLCFVSKPCNRNSPQPDPASLHQKLLTQYDDKDAIFRMRH